jgi:hypothetical protein
MPTVDARRIRQLVSEALNSQEFERIGTARWYRPTSELIWVFELDRGRSWASWALMIGIVVRPPHRAGEHADNGQPHYNDGDLIIGYELLGQGVPPAATASRFNDHRSYFTMIFDHTHDLADEEERRQAFGFMAHDLARWSNRLTTVEGLKAAIDVGDFHSALVTRRLREPIGVTAPTCLNEGAWDGTEMARGTESTSLPMRQAGCWTRPELLVWCGAPAGIEPATPSLPSMRGGFTTPCTT